MKVAVLPPTKTDKAVELFNIGNVVAALGIFKTFRIGFSAEERRTIQIAHESMTGKESFYKSIQIDTDDIKSQALQLIKSKYNI